MAKVYVVMRESVNYILNTHCAVPERVFGSLERANEYCLEFATYEWNFCREIGEPFDSWDYIAGYNGCDRDCGHFVLSRNQGEAFICYVLPSILD